MSLFSEGLLLQEEGGGWEGRGEKGLLGAARVVLIEQEKDLFPLFVLLCLSLLNWFGVTGCKFSSTWCVCWAGPNIWTETCVFVGSRLERFVKISLFLCRTWWNKGVCRWLWVTLTYSLWHVEKTLMGFLMLMWHNRVYTLFVMMNIFFCRKIYDSCSASRFSNLFWHFITFLQLFEEPICWFWLFLKCIFCWP